MWKIRPKFSYLYSTIRSRVRCLTDYIKHEKFNDILHRCGKIDLIHTSCDILDRKHHLWKIRPNFSHLHCRNIKCKVPTEYVKHEEYDRIFHRCEQFDQICQSHHIFSRIHHMWKIRPNFSHLYFTTCNKFDRICHLWGIRSSTLQLWNYGKIDNSPHSTFDRKHHIWKILSSFSHL